MFCKIASFTIIVMQFYQESKIKSRTSIQNSPHSTSIPSFVLCISHIWMRQKIHICTLIWIDKKILHSKPSTEWTTKRFAGGNNKVNMVDSMAYTVWLWWLNLTTMLNIPRSFHRFTWNHRLAKWFNNLAYAQKPPDTSITLYYSFY